MEKDPLITATIVAKRMGAKRAEVYEWARGANPMPSYRVGAIGLRFRWSEVLAWLESRRRGAAGVAA